MKSKLIVGTRGSKLALFQAETVRSCLVREFPQINVELRIIKTTGDRVQDISLSKIGDKGLFTKEIEDALYRNEIDLAVHSLKDLPTTLPEGLVIGAVLKREKSNDVLIARSEVTISTLPKGATVATGSLRRRSQLLHLRPDLDVVDIRGNVPTRIEKFLETTMDAIVLAYAGVHRLGLDERIGCVIPVEEMIPAAGQGAIAIEIRENDPEISSMLSGIDDAETRMFVTAEREFLGSLDGGCQVPIAAHALRSGEKLRLYGFVGEIDGSEVIRESMDAEMAEAGELGRNLAAVCIDRGASELLRRSRLRSQARISEERL